VSGIDPLGPVIIDGEKFPTSQAAISMKDIGLLRGYGCFEVLRSFGGHTFRTLDHIDRLEGSARMLGISLPSRDAINSWIVDCSTAGRDCLIRVIVTGGIDTEEPGRHSRVVVFAEPLPAVVDEMKVLPLDAPWHSDGMLSELTGAKTLSYAPNLAATFAARREGYDDALLLGKSGHVLEGPTFGIAWIANGVLETPASDLGILQSITQGAVLEIARREEIPISEGHFDLAKVLQANEVFAMSTARNVMPITNVGETSFTSGPVTKRISDGFLRLVSEEIEAR